MDDPTAIAQEYELVSPDVLIEHPENPRRSDDVLIEKLIRSHGFYGAITVQRSTGYVLAGNGRLRAARRIGMETVPVTWVDVSEDEAREILAGDNRASDLGGYDDQALLSLLQTMADTTGLEGTGYTDADLNVLLQQLGTEGYGTSGRGLTPAERQAAFDAADLRTVVLPYPAEKYTAVVTGLAEIMKALDVESFADVVAVLVENALSDLVAQP